MIRAAIFSLLTLSALAAPEPADDGVRVSVLGYHDFSETEPETEMRIRTSKFRAQMQALKDLNIAVVSMTDFEAWKRGEKSLPKECAVITIDDGWKSVFTDAYPILSEFGYPFTLFLYKNYVDGGGKALTSPMIEEMQKHGATLGSHSVSHPYPATIKIERRKGPDAFDKFLRLQLGESKRFIESKFDQRVKTFAYPGGFVTSEMHPLADEFGYEFLFTVLPGKVSRDSDNYNLPRYVILGTHDHIFDLAVRFGAGPTTTPQLALAVETPFPVSPEAGAMIEDRLPTISADLTDVSDLDPESLEMKIAGFGKVPATWDGESHHFCWTANRRLRNEVCHVQVTWKTTDGKAPEEPLRWSFKIDPEAAYVPQG